MFVRYCKDVYVGVGTLFTGIAIGFPVIILEFIFKLDVIENKDVMYLLIIGAVICVNYSFYSKKFQVNGYNKNEINLLRRLYESQKETTHGVLNEAAFLSENNISDTSELLKLFNDGLIKREVLGTHEHYVLTDQGRRFINENRQVLNIK